MHKNQKSNKTKIPKKKVHALNPSIKSMEHFPDFLSFSNCWPPLGPSWGQQKIINQKKRKNQKKNHVQNQKNKQNKNTKKSPWIKSIDQIHGLNKIL